MGLKDKVVSTITGDFEVILLPEPSYKESDVKESIGKLKDSIVENDIYTADEIFRLINEEFNFCITNEGGLE